MIRMTRTFLAAALLTGLAGCSGLVGGPVTTPTIYAPEPATTADPAWPSVKWTLGTVRPSAPKILDGSRIAVSPAPGELQVYKAAMWARTPAEMLEDTVLRMLED
ncbi:MAG: ABC transporter, partial [Lysobacteraceae bacterium]